MRGDGRIELCRNLRGAGRHRIARYDRPKGAQINGPHRRGRGRGRRLPKAYAAAARRLPLRSAADDPASDALIAASLPAASWNLAAAQVEGEASPKRTFKAYAIGYSISTSPGVRTAQGRLHLIVAIDRTSKLVFVELHAEVTRRAAADLLRRLKESAVATCNLKSSAQPAAD
jgi:hypothetical protein